MSTGFAAPLPPKSRINVPRREWNPKPPDSTGNTPPKGHTPLKAWAPNFARPWRRHPENPLRRLPARKEPEKWREPKRYIAFARDGVGGKENVADVNRARYGAFVSAPDNPKRANGLGGKGAATAPVAAKAKKAVVGKPPAKRAPNKKRV